jgi:hypothetical protein
VAPLADGVGSHDQPTRTAKERPNYLNAVIRVCLQRLFELGAGDGRTTRH